MQGINLVEQGHFVNVLPPVDITGGATGDRFSMKHHGKAQILVQVGVSAAAFTKILVKECDAATSGTATPIGFNYYAEETANGDTLGARASVAATGLTPSANNGIFYVIDIDARELSEGFEWVEVSFTNGANSVIASACAILTGGRYNGAEGATVLA